MTTGTVDLDPRDAHSMLGGSRLAGDPLDRRLSARLAAEGTSRLRPDEPFAVRGCVLTPDEALEDHHVVVAGAQVEQVCRAAPAGMTVVASDGVVLPGLIDLHGHPEYNVFAAWEPPRPYLNRYAWRRSGEYEAVVRRPWARLTGAAGTGADTGTGAAVPPRAAPGGGAAAQPSLLPQLTRYAEARALVGGCTAIQGASGTYPDRHQALVRNVDLWIFGEDRARSVVDLGRADAADRARLRAQVDAGEVTAVYVHLAEGVDDRSRAEFDELVAAGLLTAATVIIHGTALSAAQWRQVADAGAKLVWSPESNLRLYAATTDVAAALAAGVLVGLGADWLPSGSPCLLDELQVARRLLVAQGVLVDPDRLVRMVTSDAAVIAGLDGELGRIAPGRRADLVVLERRAADPWESVLNSDRRSVDLVVLGGDVAYGRAEWVAALAGPAQMEPVLAWGKRMALDLSYSVSASDAPPPRLADLRAALLARFPQAGPLFA
jgi:cytosine/adenosine deaminase-related metal-dependent hydrolase